MERYEYSAEEIQQLSDDLQFLNPRQQRLLGALLRYGLDRIDNGDGHSDGIIVEDPFDGAQDAPTFRDLVEQSFKPGKIEDEQADPGRQGGFVGQRHPHGRHPVTTCDLRAATNEPGRATAAQRAALPVVLVAMPFLDLDRPSIQIGLLKAIADRAGFPARTLHANLRLGEQIGADTYQALARQHGRMVGDWLFSVAAFGDAAPDPDGRLLDDFAGDLSFLAEVAEDGDVRKMLTTLRAEAVPAYLDRLADDPLWQRRTGGGIQLHVPAEHRVVRARAPLEATPPGAGDASSVAPTSTARWASNTCAGCRTST